MCDAYGFQLGLATLPGTSDTACHDDAGRELFDILREARLPIELQPRHIFALHVPAVALAPTGRKPSIVPDALMHHTSLPDIPTRIGERRGDPQPARRLLFDVKTIHAGGGSYYTRRAYDQQGGAVHERELQIWHEYQRHARELDTRFSPAGQHPVDCAYLSSDTLGVR